jgi:hypothetical protein
MQLPELTVPYKFAKVYLFRGRVIGGSRMAAEGDGAG